MISTLYKEARSFSRRVISRVMGDWNDGRRDRKIRAAGLVDQACSGVSDWPRCLALSTHVEIEGLEGLEGRRLLSITQSTPQCDIVCRVWLGWRSGT